LIAQQVDPLNARDPIMDGGVPSALFLRVANQVRVAVNGLLTGNSTTSGFLLPRMTTTQRNAIAATAGETIFSTTTSKAQTWDGGTWRDLW